MSHWRKENESSVPFRRDRPDRSTEGPRISTAGRADAASHRRIVGHSTRSAAADATFEAFSTPRRRFPAR